MIKHQYAVCKKNLLTTFLMLNISAPALATASLSQASGHSTVTGTSGTSPGGPTSTKILSELNLIAIHEII